MNVIAISLGLDSLWKKNRYLVAKNIFKATEKKNSAFIDFKLSPSSRVAVVNTSTPSTMTLQATGNLWNPKTAHPKYQEYKVSLMMGY